MQSKATTVAEYLASLPADRRKDVEAVRAVIRRNLGKGFAEGMQYGMIGYFVPHSIYAAGYHCDPRQPVPFAGLASQKQAISLYMMSLYIGGADASPLVDWFTSAWARAVQEGRAKKLDMGKACIRFKSAQDVPLDVIGEAFRRVPLKAYMDRYEASLADRRKPASKPASNAKAAAKPRAAKPRTLKKAGKKKVARRA